MNAQANLASIHDDAPVLLSRPCATTVEVESNEELWQLNTWLLCEQLRSFGASRLTLNFSGAWGDRYENVVDHDATDEKLLERQIWFYTTEDDETTEARLELVVLSDALETFIDGYLDENHPEFEVEAGGGGEFVFRTEDGTCLIATHTREETDGEDEEAGTRVVSLISDNIVDDDEDALDAGDDQASIEGGAAGLASVSTVTPSDASHCEDRLALSEEQTRLFNIMAVLCALKVRGVSEVSVSYYGSGDEGTAESPSIDEEHARDALDIEVLQLDDDGESTSYSIDEILRDMADDYISRFHSGYENNSGGSGSITFDVVNANAVWQGYNTGESDYVKSANLDDVIQGVEPASASQSLRP